MEIRNLIVLLLIIYLLRGMKNIMDILILLILYLLLRSREIDKVLKMFKVDINRDINIDILGDIGKDKLLDFKKLIDKEELERLNNLLEDYDKIIEDGDDRENKKVEIMDELDSIEKIILLKDKDSFIRIREKLKGELDINTMRLDGVEGINRRKKYSVF